MSDNITKRVGLGTAYGFAKAGGYEGTVEEFTELLGNIAIDLARIENLSVTVTTLPAGSQATASLNGSVLSLGIPKGDKGDKGNTGDTGSPAGFGTVSATVDANIGTPSVEVTASGADTAKNFAFAFHNLKGQKGDKGDTGEVSEAELAEAIADFAENGTVANAEQLTTKIRANDQTPYLFRTSGGSVDIGDREYINGIVGVSLPWNQLVNPSTATADVAGVTMAESDGVFTFTTSVANEGIYLTYKQIAGHKYLYSADIKETTATDKIKVDSWGSGAHYAQATTSWQTVAFMVGPSSTRDAHRIRIFDTRTADWDAVQVKNVMVFDLTQMFGSTIADYIYSLEQATAGAGVAFFKTLFPKPYYAYNSGELKSVSGLVSHDMVGFNQFDGEWELVEANSWYEAVNYMPVIAGATYYVHTPNIPSGESLFAKYYDTDKNLLSSSVVGRNQTFVVPTNAHFAKLRAWNTFDLSNICINLSWDGERDGEYEPYEKHSYALDSDLELRGIPKLDASNNLYYDGDTYESDGTVTRKYGVVDLGTLTWQKSATTRDNTVFVSFDLQTAIKAPPSIYVADGARTSKYAQAPAIDAINTNNPDKVFAINTNSTNPNADGQLYVVDSAYTDAATLKTALSGVYLVYELATPTTETADPYTSLQIVNDFGTEEFVISNTVAVPIPVGHNTDYPIDLKAKVEMAPNSPDGDGDYIVRQTNGTNEYVAFANNATIQNILSRLEALEG